MLLLQYYTTILIKLIQAICAEAVRSLRTLYVPTQLFISKTKSYMTNYYCYRLLSPRDSLATTATQAENE